MKQLFRRVCLCALASLFCAMLLLTAACEKSAARKTTQLSVTTSYSDSTGNDILKYQATKLEYWPESEKERSGILLSQSLTNTGTADITDITMMLYFLDKDGETLFSIPLHKVYSSDPLKSGETRSIDLERETETGADIASVSVEFLRVLTATESPAWNDPLPNHDLFTFCNDDEYLQASQRITNGEVVSVECAIKSKTEGAISFTLTSEKDEVKLDSLLLAMSKMQIGEKADVEDSGSYDFTYRIVFKDYSSITLKFQTQQLFTWRGNNYVVMDDSGVFNFDPSK